MSLKTHLLWDQKVKGQGYEAQKDTAGVDRYALVSAGFFWFMLLSLALKLGLRFIWTETKQITMATPSIV